jgi:hypothetical protein
MAMPRIALIAGLTIAAAGVALAAPPPDADPSLGPWFQSLRQPGSGASCCSISDCHRLTEQQWRETADSGYEVEIRGRWVPVPRSRILNAVENPTGGAVACYSDALRVIYCFVRESET